MDDDLGYYLADATMDNVIFGPFSEIKEIGKWLSMLTRQDPSRDFYAEIRMVNGKPITKIVAARIPTVQAAEVLQRRSDNGGGRQ